MHVVAVAPGVLAATGVIRRLLESERKQRVVVLDYRGVADRVLGSSEVDLLAEAGVVWIDLGELSRPARMLEVRIDRPSPPLFERLLQRFARVLDLPLDQCDTDAARNFVTRILTGSAEPAQGWADLRAALANEELCRWAWPGWAAEPDARLRRQRLLAVIDGTLRYPHLAAIAAAPARGLGLNDEQSAWWWVEVPRRHVEAVEWTLLAMLLHGLAEAVGSSERAGKPSRRLPLLLYPPGDASLAPLTPSHDSAGPMIVTTALHPSGHPPLLLAQMIRRRERVRVERLGTLPTHARAAWTALTGKAIGWEDDAGERALAAIISPEAAEMTQPLLLGTLAGGGSALPELRERSARERIPVPFRHLASALVSQTAFPIGGRDPFDRLCQPSTLLLAWTALLAAGGSHEPGVDLVRPRGFGARIEAELESLGADLRDERYQPQPPTWITIPKLDGGNRRIGIAAVRDRLVHRAFVYVSEPHFEPHFSDRSFGFRPGRSAHHAIVAILGAARRGCQFMAHVDVRSCFDSLPHDIILSRYGTRVASPRMLTLLSRWFRFGLGTEGLPDALGVGVVQGWVLSPFLSNVLLDDLDGQLEARGIEFGRYADDIALLAAGEKEAAEAVALVEHLLSSRLHLRLNPAKTRIQAFADGCDHLGFRIGGPGLLAIDPQRFVIARAAIAASVQSIAAVADPDLVGRAVQRIAQHMDGLAAYFCRLGLTRALADQFAELRTAIGGARAGLPDRARDHSSWARLLNDNELLGRYGRFEGARPHDPVSPALPYGPGRPTAGAWHDSETVVGGNSSSQTLSVAPEPPAEAIDTSVDRDGPTLLIARGGVGIYADGTALWLRRGGKEILRMALADLELILVQSYGVHLSSRAAWSLAAADVSLLIANPGGDDIAVLAAPGGARSHVRIAQARRLDAPELLQAAAGMLKAKLANQASVLRYLARAPGRRSSDSGGRLVAAAAEIRSGAERLDDESPSGEPARERIARWMGHEGLAAARYWTALAAIVPADLGFPGRRTRDAQDPVNQALNYAYALLYADIWRAVARSGLDPGIALLHVGTRSVGGLVYDLIEELRAPLVDRLVFSLLGRGWRPASKRGPEALLRPHSRQVLSRAYRKQRGRTIRRGRGSIRVGEIPWTQARALQALVLGEAASYPAFHFRW